MPQDGKVWTAYMYAHMPIDLQPANQTVRVTLNFLHCRGNKAVWSQRNSTDSLSIALCAHTTLSGRGDFLAQCGPVSIKMRGRVSMFHRVYERPQNGTGANLLWNMRGGGSGQAIKLIQAHRKISFTFYIFDTSLSSLMMWNLQSYYPTTMTCSCREIKESIMKLSTG